MKVFSAPENVKTPTFFDANDHYDPKEYETKEVAFYASLKAELQSLGYTGFNTGELVRFPIADGYAVYMVAEDNKGVLSLIHSPLGDAYSISEAHARGLNKKDILQHIGQHKAMRKLFSSKAT